MSQLSFVRGIDEWIFDGFFPLRGERPTRTKIVLVCLDDQSLDKIAAKKPLSFISPELAAVVRHADAQGAAVIGIDLFIPESLDALPDINGTAKDPKGDARAMAEALLDLRQARVVLPQFPAPDGSGWRRPLRQWQVRTLLDPQPYDFGNVELNEDDDQFVRRQQLLAGVGDDAVPYFALALAAAARREQFRADFGERSIRLGGSVIPLDSERKLRINFAGPPGKSPFRSVSFWSMCQAAMKNETLPYLRDAIVLIGMMGRGGQDHHATPFANLHARYIPGDETGLMAGIEIHAHTVATILDEAYITTPRWLAGWLWLPIVGGLLGWWFARLRLEQGFVLAVVHHFAWKGLAYSAFLIGGWRVEVMPMLMLGGLAFVATFTARWRVMRRMMGVVKSEAVARALEADPGKLALVGERRTITVLFADIRGFTAFSEHHPPEAVVRLLNDYFGAIVPLIEAEEGTIDKFMGDGLMAVFGAPETLPDHAVRAVRAARALVACVSEKGIAWARLVAPGFRWPDPEHPDELRIGVGICTGEAIIGCVGSKQRLDYTAIGDTVNAAARLEAANKEQKTVILIDAATAERLSGAERIEFGVEEQPRSLMVRNKAEPLRAFAVRFADSGEERCPPSSHAG